MISWVLTPCGWAGLSGPLPSSQLVSASNRPATNVTNKITLNHDAALCRLIPSIPKMIPSEDADSRHSGTEVASGSAVNLASVGKNSYTSCFQEAGCADFR